MITNQQMRPGRYLQLAIARSIFRLICSTLEQGGTVTVATYTKAAHYTGPAHRDTFRLAGHDIYVRRGKHWDCIVSGGRPMCGIRYTPA